VESVIKRRALSREGVDLTVVGDLLQRRTDTTLYRAHETVTLLSLGRPCLAGFSFW